jgi:hypothetical protein
MTARADGNARLEDARVFLEAAAIFGSAAFRCLSRTWMGSLTWFDHDA